MQKFAENKAWLRLAGNGGGEFCDMRQKNADRPGIKSESVPSSSGHPAKAVEIRHPGEPRFQANEISPRPRSRLLPAIFPSGSTVGVAHPSRCSASYMPKSRMTLYQFRHFPSPNFNLF